MMKAKWKRLGGKKPKEGAKCVVFGYDIGSYDIETGKGPYLCGIADFYDGEFWCSFQSLGGGIVTEKASEEHPLSVITHFIELPPCPAREAFYITTNGGKHNGD